MQNPGDSTEEESGTTATNNSNHSQGGAGVIARWFPNGFYTKGVDWAALDEHLSMVPDLAYEVTSTTGSNGGVVASELIPKGICALHLVVSCNHPPAPLSLVQRFLNVNPDALHQVETSHGWNVLHIAVKFNQHLSTDQRLIEMLLHANPHLATEVSMEEDCGCHPLAYAQCKEVVPVLVKAMPTNAVTTILKNIFSRRRLLGGSVEAMEQIIRELSVLELRHGRSILAPGILPKTATRRQQSLVEYTLLQASLRRRNTVERGDMMRLVDLIIQATYCLSFHKDGDEHAICTAPSPLQCLKTLVIQQKIKRHALDQYQSTKISNQQYRENLDLVEPEHHHQHHDFFTNHQSTEYEEETTAQLLANNGGEPTGQLEQCRNPHLLPAAEEEERIHLLQAIQEEKPVLTNPYVQKLLKSKDEMDAKIDRSFDILRQTALALEGYKELYSKTVEKLCRESKAMDEKTSSRIMTAKGSMAPTAGIGAEEENMAAIRAVVALSSSNTRTEPPKPPMRQESDDSITKEKSPRHRLDAAIQEAIENMKAASNGLDRYNKSLASESGTLLREQEDQKIIDMGYFRSKEHDQVIQAMEDISDCQIQRKALMKCVEDVKRQLHDDPDDAESEVPLKMEERHELNLRWVKLNGEMRDVNRKIENLRELVTIRRQDLGAHMIKARRLINGKGSSCSKVVRTKATRFLRQAKKEMRDMMDILIATAGRKVPAAARQKKKKWRQKQQQQQQQQKAAEEEEELTRMTKRMKL